MPPASRRYGGRSAPLGFELAAQQFFADAAILVLELLAADLGADAGAQHLELARLGDVIVGAGAEAFQHRTAIVESREQDQRNVANTRRRLDAQARLGTADTGHHQIHENAVDRLHREEFDSLFAGTRQHHVVAFAAQRRCQFVQIGLAVVDRQNLARTDEADEFLTGDARRVPHHRRQPGEDDLHVLFLADEGIGAGIEGAQLCAAVVGGREQQAWRRPEGRVKAHAADQRCPIHVGHHAIDDDRVRPEVGDHGEPFIATGGGEHRIAGALQRLPEHLAERRAVVDDEHGRLARRRSPCPQQFARLGDDVFRIVGLADVFVGAGLQAADAVLHLRFARQHDHRRRAPLRHGAQLLEQVDAIAVGQDHIEDDKADVLVAQRFSRLGNRRTRHRLEAGGLERVGEVHAHREAVIDDEDRLGHRATPLWTIATTAGPISPSGSTLIAAPISAASRGMP